MSKYWIRFKLKINPYLPQPMAGDVLSAELAASLGQHDIESDVRRVRRECERDGKWNDLAHVEQQLADLA